ncbi:uncharacterized protein LOC118183589, partial [Stegodyphus dumicola]|uniref:uncharacterized protein LOC118183589 n=1 Tax=Stegodyphus dumicola TaxID=202533 RepID=UPI0015B35353
MTPMANYTKTRLFSQITAFGLSLAVVCVSTVNPDSLDKKQNISDHRHIQKRSLLTEDVDLVEVCSSIQSFEQLETAINVDLLTVEIHPEAWVFATKCRVPGKPCKGFD